MLLCQIPFSMFTCNSFQMSCIKNSAFLILEIINLETQLSSPNGKRLHVYPEINKLKGMEDCGHLQIESFGVVYLAIGHLFPHNIALLLVFSSYWVWPAKPKQKMFHIRELFSNHQTEKMPFCSVSAAKTSMSCPREQ